MLQVAAALLFAAAAGIGLVVILAMLKNNEGAVLSALLGEGAFPMANAPEPGPAPRAAARTHPAPRHDRGRPMRNAAALRPQLSRAA